MPSHNSKTNAASDEASRKRLYKPSSSKILDDPSTQKTISELFSASKQGSDKGSDDRNSPSPSKRAKLGHAAVATSNAPQPHPPGKKDMYNFTSSSSKTAVGGAVDLTSSPNGSPAKKRLNGFSRPSNPTAQTGPKKLVVKNLKTVARADPNEYFSKVWTQLDTALTAIFEDGPLPFSMEELYKGVEFSCRQERAREMYLKLRQKCLDAVQGRCEECKAIALQGSDNSRDVLRAVVNAWLRWNRQFKNIRSIFYYLDRSFLLHSTALPTLQTMGTGLFRESLFHELCLQVSTLQGACDLVAADRKGQMRSGDNDLLQQAIEMFQSLAVYIEHFEPRLLAESQQFYIAWVEQTVRSNDLTGFVEMCDALIAQELERCTKLGLESSTRGSLQQYMEEILVDQEEDRLVEKKDVGELLAANRVEVLKRLYSLLDRRQLGDRLRPAFEAYIDQEGSNIVFDKDKELEMVSRLLALKQKLDNILEEAFKKNVHIGHGLREAFEIFINRTPPTDMSWGTDNSKPGEMIAKHVDTILKGGAKAVRTSLGGTASTSKAADENAGEDDGVDEDVEISKALDQVLDLFRFVHGKAVFEAFYKTDLSRRLLLGRSASADAEKSMLTRLKTECGAGFTYNLEQMFKDMELARGEVASYKSMLQERGKRMPFDLSVNVLSAAAWPSTDPVPIHVPEMVQKAMVDFEEHYRLKHTGRNLNWRHNLSHCQLRAVFPKGNKEIVVSASQATVLLAFNDSDNLSYQDIQAHSGLEDPELQRTLQSLACARYRVLRKHPLGKEVNPSDKFAINTSFEHAKYRIKINEIQAKETPAENKATHERVLLDRQFETQAAIVRIMKGRKTIRHAELVSEVISATKSRGNLDPADIKREIEKLIEKEYMEREAEEGDDRNLYHYVA